MRLRERMRNHVQAASGYSTNIWQPSCIPGNKQYAPDEERMEVGRMRRGMFGFQTSLFSLSVSTSLSACSSLSVCGSLSVSSSLSYPYHLIRINKDLFYTDSGVFFPRRCVTQAGCCVQELCVVSFVAAPHSAAARSFPVLCIGAISLRDLHGR